MRIPEDHWMRNTAIAHRGLWNKDIPENSLLAYKNAADNGFAIEIDVHLTTDGEVVSFHDATLLRMTGVDRKITDCSLKELKGYKLLETEYTIPTLKEILPIVKDKSPLLIELKSYSKEMVGKLEKATYDILKDYDGDFAIQSFNPFSVKWFTDNAPEIIRGQLSSYFIGDSMKRLNKLLLKKLFFNNQTKVDFVSYDQRNIPNRYIEKAKREGKVIIAWTVVTSQREKELQPIVDNIIFENYVRKTNTFPE